jgi:hypothetical protein
MQNEGLQLLNSSGIPENKVNIKVYIYLKIINPSFVSSFFLENFWKEIINREWGFFAI